MRHTIRWKLAYYLHDFQHDSTGRLFVKWLHLKLTGRTGLSHWHLIWRRHAR